MRTSLVATCLALGLAVAGSVRAPSPAVLLDRKSSPYLEDNGSGRVLAHLEALLWRRDGGTHLELAIEAVHPSVDPVPGFAGIAGANLRTARELDELVRTSALAVITRDGQGGSVAGRSRASRRGAIPERRLRDDGSLDVNAVSPEQWVLALHVDSGALEPGRHETDLVVAGASRLRVTFVVERDGGQILDVASLPDPLVLPRTQP